MKISKSIDVTGKAAPSADSGTQPWDNPGIKPNDPGMTPGEKETNSTTEYSHNKPQPFKKTGSGY